MRINHRQDKSCIIFSIGGVKCISGTHHPNITYTKKLKETTFTPSSSRVVSHLDPVSLHPVCHPPPPFVLPLLLSSSLGSGAPLIKELLADGMRCVKQKGFLDAERTLIWHEDCRCYWQLQLQSDFLSFQMKLEDWTLLMLLSALLLTTTHFQVRKGRSGWGQGGGV